jgi:hypothetical protein
MFGLKFAQFSKIKICPKTFCPKWRFTKSVPGLLEELLLSVPGLHGREDVEEAGRVADDIAVAVVDEDLRSNELSSKHARDLKSILKSELASCQLDRVKVIKCTPTNSKPSDFEVDLWIASGIFLFFVYFLIKLSAEPPLIPWDQFPPQGITSIM